MTYLDIARRIDVRTKKTNYTKEVRRERNSGTDYERNELHEKSPRTAELVVMATVPPSGWNGALCAGCRWPALCRVLGPRGPHLPGGPCSTWPRSVGGASVSDPEVLS